LRFDVVLPDGRNGYLILGIGDVSGAPIAYDLGLLLLNCCKIPITLIDTMMEFLMGLRKAQEHVLVISFRHYEVGPGFAVGKRLASYAFD